ncbi:acyl dehydratase [Kitasatospora sp. GP30]|uniref:MaoC family dehydratase N-terminal domain-containing protein n=1 Tax=Kitasatospora sp. GP30 TaxID=3035084 RepID=UPI000C70B8D8|nr:MaoC family dehydratase N-terminal domain-containing protein [Kitasatospora sp. GP30]MDH6140896.1 acyl dehydratase [Kitasatospora sp. GP30]
MALDPSFIGRSYPPTAPYEVGREKIREFALAVGDLNPAYLDQSAAKALGYPDVIAPPTFAIALAVPASDQVIEDPALGLDYSRVVHGDQKFSYSRPLRAGDRVRVTVRIENIKSLAGNDVLTVTGEMHEESGEHLVTTVMTLVARAVPDDETKGE